MKIEDIPRPVLEAVRQRLGKDSSDTSNDEQIKNMTPERMLEEYSAWELGDPTWGRDMICFYNILKAAEGRK